MKNFSVIDPTGDESQVSSLAYNLVTNHRTDVFYANLEMPYTQVVDKFYAMHSSNPRFRALGYAPLTYAKVTSGELTPEEEKFWKLVITDFSTNKEYGSLHFWSPIEDVSVADIREKAEGLGLVIIDHPELALDTPREV